ncbi:ASCH domain-containing protein [Phytomonospora sp. NPDC050363]|uniref:ASCH domain-containing protein n=1 Tax=Phytomonospora sp. NPDC050363 TaxID=3155642 RepID=UPI0033FF1E0D
MWPRVNGLRALELGTPGRLRARLNSLVLSGDKTATASLLDEYGQEREVLEQVGERLALLDDAGEPVAVVEVTAVETVPFGEVDMAFAFDEGEGYTSVEHWRETHAEFWAELGTPVTAETPVVCLHFRLAD